MLKSPPGIHFIPQSGRRLAGLLGGLRIIPEIGRGYLFFQLKKLVFLGR
jgi:hypothetical protein